MLLWLKQQDIPALAVYTKADKLSGNKRNQMASTLDAGHSLTPNERVSWVSAPSIDGSNLMLSQSISIILGTVRDTCHTDPPVLELYGVGSGPARGHTASVLLLASYISSVRGLTERCV